MIDARGLSCPQPVILIKKEVDKSHEEQYELLTDNMTCVENVSRFADSAGYDTEYSREDGGDFLVKIKRRA